jgi:hypothetical protein
MEERPRRVQKLDLGTLAALGDISLRPPETPEERASRLKREEAEASHKHRIELIVHVFALAILAVAFLAGICIVTFGDPKTGLPDKAIAMVAGIVVALASYVAGSRSK